MMPREFITLAGGAVASIAGPLMARGHWPMMLPTIGFAGGTSRIQRTLWLGGGKP